MVYSKSIVLLGLVIVVLFAAVAWTLVRGGRRQESFEGYFAPVYSPDGQQVFFVERRSHGTVRQTQAPDLFFNPAHYDVFVAKDTFTLKRLDLQSGQIDDLVQFAPSPLEGQKYEAIGNPLKSASARLRFTKKGLEYDVCLTAHQMPEVKESLASGVWAEGQHAADVSWQKKPCMLGGFDEWPLFGASELIVVRSDRAFFPVAIVAYNHDTNALNVLVKNKDYDRVFPKGVPLQQVVQSSRRQDMERMRTMLRTHEELLQKYKSMGMTEVQALLRTGKDMQSLGYYPKTPTMIARRLSPDEAEKAEAGGDGFFTIAKGEMDAGLFQDIERAINKPGEETDKTSDGYFTHRDYTTSARLNAYLNTGKTQFFVQYLDNTYEVTIKKP